ALARAGAALDAGEAEQLRCDGAVRIPALHLGDGRDPGQVVAHDLRSDVDRELADDEAAVPDRRLERRNLRRPGRVGMQPGPLARVPRALRGLRPLLPGLLPVAVAG